MNKNQSTIFYRPLTRGRAEDSNYTNDDLVIVSEFQKLQDQVPSQIIKNRIFHIKNLFQSNTLNKQQDLDNLKQEIETIRPQNETMKSEVSAIKRKCTDLEREKTKILQESEEQITILTQENKDLKITIDSLQQQNMYHKLLIEEKEEALKKQKQEAVGHEFLIDSLKNTIQNISQKNPINYYQTAQYNSSFDISSLHSSSEINLHKNDSIESNGFIELSNLQSELEAINKNFQSKDNLIKYNEDIRKTKAQVKSPSNKHTHIENNILEKTIEIEQDKSQQYLTPNIEITNDKPLQKKLESEGIINKNNNIEPKTKSKYEKSSDNIVQIQINELREQTDLHALQIQNILETINERTSNKRTTSPTKNIENTSDNKEIKPKNKCYLIGDYHLKNIGNSLRKNKKFSESFELITKISSDFKFQHITKEIFPKTHNKNDILVISCGTNDLYKTNSKIQEAIIDIQNQNINTILISVPPQNCLLTNRDIRKFNTLMKHQISKENIHVINTHKLIQTNDLDVNGTTLLPTATKKLGNKIIKTLFYIQNTKKGANNIIHVKKQSKVDQLTQKKSYKKIQQIKDLHRPHTHQQRNNQQMYVQKSQRQEHRVLWEQKQQQETRQHQRPAQQWQQQQQASSTSQQQQYKQQKKLDIQYTKSQQQHHKQWQEKQHQPSLYLQYEHQKQLNQLPPQRQQQWQQQQQQQQRQQHQQQQQRRQQQQWQHYSQQQGENNLQQQHPTTYQHQQQQPQKEHEQLQKQHPLLLSPHLIEEQQTTHVIIQPRVQHNSQHQENQYIPTQIPLEYDHRQYEMHDQQHHTPRNQWITQNNVETNGICHKCWDTINKHPYDENFPPLNQHDDKHYPSQQNIRPFTRDHFR